MQWEHPQHLQRNGLTLRVFEPCLTSDRSVHNKGAAKGNGEGWACWVRPFSFKDREALLIEQVGFFHGHPGVHPDLEYH